MAFIGDYSTRLPSQHTIGLVKDQLASCAVGGGRLIANYGVQGHRQVVTTTCPGDALYKEITGWEHFVVCRSISIEKENRVKRRFKSTQRL